MISCKFTTVVVILTDWPGALPTV